MLFPSSPESTRSSVGSLINLNQSLDVFKKPAVPKFRKKQKILDEETYIHVSMIRF